MLNAAIPTPLCTPILAILPQQMFKRLSLRMHARSELHLSRSTSTGTHPPPPPPEKKAKSNIKGFDC